MQNCSTSRVDEEFSNDKIFVVCSLKYTDNNNSVESIIYSFELLIIDPVCNNSNNIKVISDLKFIINFNFY